jgi:hypothetical protein
MRRLHITLPGVALSAVLTLASAVGAQASTVAAPVPPPAVHASVFNYQPGHVITTHVMSTSAPTAQTAFWKGYGTVCGGTTSGDCQSWRVALHFEFTLTNTPQAFVNQFSSKWCTASGTTITWCGYTGNGTDKLSIGANFGNGGWVRFTVWVIDTGIYYWTWNQTKVSWANWGAWCVKEDNGCY